MRCYYSIIPPCPHLVVVVVVDGGVVVAVGGGRGRRGLGLRGGGGRMLVLAQRVVAPQDNILLPAKCGLKNILVSKKYMR